MYVLNEDAGSPIGSVAAGDAVSQCLSQSICLNAWESRWHYSRIYR